MAKTLFSDIVLDREEQYDASKLDCWSFSSGTDVKNGVPLKLGNMLNAFPVTIEGVTYACSELLYLCGEFSNNTLEHRKIRAALAAQANGLSAKRTIKKPNKALIREDFYKFATQWMLWVVWQKTLQNKDFQQILRSIPSSAIIIEDSTWQTSETATLWGCKNQDQRRVRPARKKELEADYADMRKNKEITKKKLEEIIKLELRKLDNVGIHKGKNNMGKILMICKRAIENNTEPHIDYGLLKRARIYLNSNYPLFKNS